MPIPRILALGRFHSRDLVTTTSESNRKINPLIEDQIENTWEAKVKRVNEQGKIIYNGLFYRLNSLKEENEKLFLDFGTIDYKTSDSLINIPEYFELPEPFYRKGCYTAATVKTSDDRYLMVELSGKSLNENTIDQLGGVMETDPRNETGDDVFQSLYKELEEEGHITEKDIQSAFLRAVFVARRTNVAFYFEVILNVSSDDLLARFESMKKDIDIKSLKSLSRQEYIDILLDHNANKQLMAQILSI